MAPIKKSFKLGSYTVYTWLTNYLEGKKVGDYKYKEFSIERIGTGISFFIQESEVFRFNRNGRILELFIFLNGRDDDGNPSKKFREYVNTILTCFDEVEKLPRIRLFFDNETKLVFLGNQSTGKTFVFNKDYTSGCKITMHIGSSCAVIYQYETDCRELPYEMPPLRKRYETNCKV